MKNISLCMVVHNEASRIENCIKAALPYVHEVIIANQESSDNTLEVLLELKKQVGNRFTIIEDFYTGTCNTSRQETLNRARYDWRLILDADECIEDFSCLQRLANSNRSYLYAFRRKNYVDGVFMPFLYPDHQPRLIYKNIKWPNKVHVSPHDDSRIDVDDAVILHYRSWKDILEAQKRYMTMRPEANLDDHKQFLIQTAKLLNIPKSEFQWLLDLKKDN